MKFRYKLLSLVLALLMTIPFFASCNSGKTGSGDTENRQTQETEEKQETKVSQDTEQTESLTSAVTKADAEQEYKPNIPQTNYDDEFYLLIQPSSNVFEYHWVEESGNDLLTQAIFERQQKVQEHLGVEVVGIKAEIPADYIEPFKNMDKPTIGRF